MEIRTRRRSLGELARAVGRHPGRVLVGLLVWFGVGSWALWASQLWGLPDVGDPFDVAAFEGVRVPDDRNAFFWYGDAAGMLTQLERANRAQKKVAVRFGNLEGDWSKVDAPWRDLLAGAGEALAVWRVGSEKPDARYNHPEGLSFRTLLPVTQQVRMLAKLAVLEGMRLEARGDVLGAWGWYRASLRSSRHGGKHGFQVERLMGAAMHDDAAKAITRWAADPRVDASLLRRALDEVIAIGALTVPRSEALKMHYLVFVHGLRDPNLIEDVLVDRNPDDPADWCQELPVSPAVKKPIQAARVILSHDYERSLLVARLMMANWLAEVDKPPSRRAKLARVAPPIYEADPAAPPASRALPPEVLSKWLDSSLLASRLFRGLDKYTSWVERERPRQARLIVHLADQLYRREHGQPPPNPRALVGPYLKALPEGYDEPEVPMP